MSKILRQWISVVTGDLLDGDTITSRSRNGYLIAQILLSYSIITQDQLNWIINDDDNETVLKNFRLIQTWLRLIDIKLSDEDVNELIKCEASTSISFMFQMYLKLQDKAILTSQTQLLKYSQNIYAKTGSRFSVKTILNYEKEDSEYDSVNVIYWKYKSANNVIKTSEHVYKWYECKMKENNRKLTELRLKCQKRLHELYEKFNENIKIKLKETIELPSAFQLQCGDAYNINHIGNLRNTTYQESIRKDEYIQNLNTFVPNEEKSKDILKKIQNKYENVIHVKEVLTQVETVMFSKTYNNLLDEMQKYLLNHILNKLLTLSKYESQMVQKMREIINIKDLLLNNHVRTMNLMDDYKTLLSVPCDILSRDHYVLNYDLYSHEVNKVKDLYIKLDERKKELYIKRINKFCNEIANYFVNMAWRRIEFEECYNHPPTRQTERVWRACFIKNLSLYDLVELFDLTYYNDKRETDEKFKEIFRKELHRQKKLDEYVIQNYVLSILAIYKPTVSDILPHEDIIKNSDTIIHKLLHTFKLAKYPECIVPKPEELPDFKIATCIIGLNDKTILPILKKSLVDNQIVVIEMAYAINHCMETYIKEDKYFAIGKIFAKTSRRTFDWIFVEKKHQMYKDEKIDWKLTGTPKKDHHLSIDESEFPFRHIDKSTQITKDDEDIVVLSQKGELGKLAFLYLYLGTEIPNKYLTLMFVEYLKSLKNANGWILINYPETMEQAAYLEEALTGVKCFFNPFNKSTITDLDDLEMRKLTDVPQISPIEHDILLYKSHQPLLKHDPYYATYLTSFIFLHEIIQTSNSFDFINENIDFLSELNEFYISKGIYYLFEYENFTYATVLQLADLIIVLKDDVSDKGSLHSFEFQQYVANINENNENEATGICIKIGQKLEKAKERFDYSEIPSPTSVNVKSEEGSKKSKKDKKKDKVKITLLRKENKGTQIPEIDESSDITETTNIIPVDIPMLLPKEFQIMLATTWEMIEKTFCKDLTTMYFKFRIFVDDHEQYTSTIVHMMDIYLKRPCNRQKYLEEYQMFYNSIEDEFRNDEEVKVEIHCKIDDLKNDLFKLCEDDRQSSINYEKWILANEWIPKIVIMCIDSHCHLLQIELNYLKDILQLISDYYVSVMTKIPCTKLLIAVKLLPFPNENYENGKKYILDCMNEKDVVSLDNILLNHMEINYNIANGALENYKTFSKNIIKEMDLLYKNREKTDKFNNAAVEHFSNLINEWTELIEGECKKRFINLLSMTKRSEETIVQLLKNFVSISLQIRNMIKDRYEDEEKWINTVCGLLRGLNESEERIKERFVFEDGKFYIESNVHMFLEQLPPIECTENITQDEYLFNLNNLKKLIEIFYKIAPNGIIPERCFTYLLQNIIILKVDFCVPLKWKELNSEQLYEVIDLIFETHQFIDWRDFIVYNLDVTFPNDEDILNARREFQKFDPDLKEFIPIYHLANVNLWFEERNPNGSLIKELLSNVFKLHEIYFNYTAMLLAFCKDHNSMKGFIKAVELCLGAYVCRDKTTFEKTSQHLLTSEYKSTIVSEEEKSVAEEESIIEESNEWECQCEMNEYHYKVVDESEICDCFNEFNESQINYSFSEESSCTCSDKSKCELNETFFASLELIKFVGPPNNIDQNTFPTVYAITFDVLLKVFGATLLKLSGPFSKSILKTELEEMYNNCKDLQYDNVVFAHNMFNNQDFKKLINENYKFLEKNIQRILTSVLNKDY